MSFESLQLQTYAGYVWSCYALTLVALGGVAIVVRRRWREAERQALRRLAMQGSGTASSAIASSTSDFNDSTR